MYFSEQFNVDKQKINEYGAIDILLVCDLPLFIDPMLIFNSGKKEYKDLHDKIIKYFAFLAEKAKYGVSKDDLRAYFLFPEVKNNWLGFSKGRNEGRGLGKDFASFLANNLSFIMEDNSISQSKHVEKALLLYDGNGKDKISDLTANLILGFLAEYTQKFCSENLNSKYLKSFYVDSEFNYFTESFISKEYILPYCVNRKGEEEYVLLTPTDILRRDDPAISKKSFSKSYHRVRNLISISKSIMEWVN